MTTFFQKLNRMLQDDDEFASASIQQKVMQSLVSHVYKQNSMALLTSLFCAIIIFMTLYNPSQANLSLNVWGILFLIISIGRMIVIHLYYRAKDVSQNLLLWRNLYILGSLLAGLTWGASGIIFLPYVSDLQQMIMILMLAGVTAGAVPLSASIPQAAIAFLVSLILPFIISIASFGNEAYLLFDLALALYLIYSIFLVVKSYQAIKHSMILQFENDSLLANLLEAKKQLEESNKKLEEIATHDPLTQVVNRNLFPSNMRQAIDRAKENHQIFALLYLDIDRFKLINDSYGHQTGDIILKEVTARLKEIIPDVESIARVGGDEFTIILKNISSREEVRAIAKRICASIIQPIKVNNEELNVGASIGISLYPYQGEDVETLIQCADKMMYYVKDHGGNNCCFYGEPLSS